MPLDYLGALIFDGPENVPGWKYIKTYGPLLALIGGTKFYFGGASNTWEREMHGRVFLITGGTSGLGASIAYELALKGAQIILLVRSTQDSWIVDFVEDMRERTGNFMIYAEDCDLDSLHSIRKFSTKWLDNQPPRRLDGIICCAAECLPMGKSRQVTVDGIEKQIGVNYVAHYHLLTLLSPSLRVQPPDRDVRVVVSTCSSQAFGEIDLQDPFWIDKRYPASSPWKVFGSSKLMLGMFAMEFQRKLDSYERPDKAPNNVRVNIVNPGFMRSPSTRRFLSMGSIMGLFLYLLLYPVFFLLLKSSHQGAQSFFYALTAPKFKSSSGGNIIQECKVIKPRTKALENEELQVALFEKTAEILNDIEKKSAIERKKQEKREKALPRKTKNGSDSKAATSSGAATGKPDNLNDLDQTLSKLRSLIGVPSQSPGSELPLFPQDPSASSSDFKKK